MQLIKLGLLSIFFLFIVATGVSLLIPSHIRISKAINIHAGKDSIFALIKNTKRWKQWHPAFMHGNQAPKFPAINISLQTENDSEIIMQLQQGNKPPVINGWKLYHYQSPDSVTLQWYMNFHLKWYPWQKFGSMFFENTYGVMMQQGLSNIKEISQK